MANELSNLPVAPDDAFISGQTWNLLRRIGRQSTPPIPGTFEFPQPPRGIEMLMVIVDSGPNGEADPTDNTYWLKNVDVTPAEGSGGSLVDPENTRIEVAERASGDESIIWKLGTNLAEDVAGTHSVPIGTPVRAKLVEDSSGYRRWEFSSSVGSSEQTYPAKIEEWCNSKGGTYKVSVYMGPTTLVPAACMAGTLATLNMPEGMTVPTQWVDDLTGLAILMLAVHVKEDGLKTHWLKVGSWTVGTIRMSTNGYPVFFIQDGYARSIGGPLMDSGNVSLAASSTGAIDSWTRDFIDNQAGDANQKGDSPVQLTEVTRVSYNPGSSGNCQQFPPSLDFGLRIKQYDAQGHLAGIGSELAQLSIPGCCPPSTSLSSPSFATEADATYARAISASIAASNTLG